ncbi:PD-(D/E)XK nuclease family protein [Histidinibacterium lentulum]|uniref:PD-(D/E)XK nuclease family protein n=1 Tax=Histidinibacterium lentulum TaxID=2480588 RepID=UPI001FE3CF98|nr:PD-(D/E)XK nuclease family protein [Histidinibacterium lentulum]
MSTPRLFALPPGVDFGAELVRGLDQRTAGLPPEEAARITIYVNTRRMQRHVRAIQDRGPAALLPRLRLLTDLSRDPVPGESPCARALPRRLALMRLVRALLEAEPDLAPRAALFDLADSLAGLLDEMEVEGVPASSLTGLDGTESSAHWQEALKFLQIIRGVLDAGPPGEGGRLRHRALALAESWRTAPPPHPVVVAGSTGSRGATAEFLAAVARLPNGFVVLPGFDFELPPAVWDGMSDAMQAEDHPQYRFKRLLDRLGLRPGDVARWTDAQPANPARNRLVSLSLRPAPVTDAWLAEGAAMDPEAAARGLTLVEAPSPRAEADTIALGMRAAAAEGRIAALITPDRMLTRRVAAALDRWGITPDDSAGQPLPLSPPGRLLRQTLELMTARPTGASLLALLKHPLCHAGADRNRHLLHTRDLELHLRRHGPAHPDGAMLRSWAARDKAPSDRAPWADWLAGLLDLPVPGGDQPVPVLLAHHLARAESLSAGPGATPTLWDEAAGRKARETCDGLARAGDAAGPLALTDYATLFLGVLNGEEVRNPDTGDPRILIWGTLESRVQGADLVILGGLNDGTWPEAPPPDPWLNRAMRREAGLTLPERRIGLSAHDYEQAVAGAQVWLCRATRTDEASTVPSRWLNRLTNLMAGLGPHGEEALADMRTRGADWIARAEALSRAEAPVDAAPRPSPRPHPDHRPRRISVTEVQRLIRDPYAVYARRVLRLSPLDPLVAEADAPLRGTIVHAALEEFVRTGPPPDHPSARDALMAAVERALERDCPWPAQRRLWAARMARVADTFLEGERARRAMATPTAFETDGELEIPICTPPILLTGKADRIDLLPDGRIALYDYKTGAPPSEKQQLAFDKQLLLQAAMAARGGYGEVGPAETAIACFIGLGADPKVVPAPFDKAPPDEVWEKFVALLRRWLDPARGYTARARTFTDREASDYDHLARFGEWDPTMPPVPEDVR